VFGVRQSKEDVYKDVCGSTRYRGTRQGVCNERAVCSEGGQGYSIMVRYMIYGRVVMILSSLSFYPSAYVPSAQHTRSASQA